jgi:hypothetical protein
VHVIVAYITSITVLSLEQNKEVSKGGKQDTYFDFKNIPNTPCSNV